MWWGWSGLGWAGLGWAGLGWAGLGWAGLGWAGLGWAAVRCGAVRCGVVWCGVVWCGVVVGGGGFDARLTMAPDVFGVLLPAVCATSPQLPGPVQVKCTEAQKLRTSSLRGNGQHAHLWNDLHDIAFVPEYERQEHQGRLDFAVQGANL